MAHLSKKEKKEMLEMAASEELRRDFKAMKENSKKHKMSIDEYVEFLTSASKVFPAIKSPRKHKDYKNVKI